MALLRAIVVTNQNTKHEGVVIAVELYPRHKNPEEAIRCKDERCARLHTIVELSDFRFNFERRQIDLLAGGLMDVIPTQDLSKFKADFGVYYSS